MAIPHGFAVTGPAWAATAALLPPQTSAAATASTPSGVPLALPTEASLSTSPRSATRSVPSALP
ncbi:MAG: hypothetical protein JO143_13350 [Acetobacteraceae bacterium]|nr:hypothetical protein [Acetobacteraceae bacterium]